MKPISITNRPKRRPRQGGSVRNERVTDFELAEYRQNGCIRIKETAAEGLSFHPWNRGLCGSINFVGILGGREVFDLPDDWELPASAVVLDTADYGLVAIDSFPEGYIVKCYTKWNQSLVSNLLNMCGYESRSAYKGGLWVWKPRKRFVAYEDWKREQEEEKKFRI